MLVKVGEYETTIKDRDFEKFSKLKWHPHRGKADKGLVYFMAHIWVNGKRTTIPLHRYLMDCVHGDGKIVDHIDGNTLNNDTDNLRVCTKAENCRNRKKDSDSTSPYKGIYWHKQAGKWRAQIVAQGKYMSLGLFPTAELAYEAYCKAVPLYHGEFGRLK